MNHNTKEKYKRLPGKSGFIILYSSKLWMGSDHLLLVHSVAGVEKYNRFYYRDIQSIITSKTITGKIWNVIIGVLLGIFLLLATTTQSGWSGFNTVMAAGFFLWLTIHLWRGPTCNTFLQTAIHTKKLSSLNRTKNTKKSMDRLKIVIEKTQGKLSPEVFKENVLKQPMDSGLRGTTAVYTPAKREPRHETGKIHALLFALLIIDAFFIIPTFFLTHVSFTIFSTIISLAVIITVIIALVKQAGSTIPGAIQKMTWTSMVFICISLILGYGFSLTMAFENMEVAYNQWELFKRVSKISPLDNTFMMGLHIYSLCGSFLIGIPGLVLLKHYWRNKRRASIE